MSRATALQKRYWSVVVKLGCAVTGDTEDVTIHHVHGGSMKERGVHRAEGRKGSNWLVIGLRRGLHIGPGGIDGFPRPPVHEWERKHGRQADMIDRLVARTGINVWDLAREEEKPQCDRTQL